MRQWLWRAINVQDLAKLQRVQYRITKKWQLQARSSQQEQCMARGTPNCNLMQLLWSKSTAQGISLLFSLFMTSVSRPNECTAREHS